MGDFSIGGPDAPYHLTGEHRADKIVREGYSVHAGRSGESPITKMRRLFDEERPSRFPAHTGAFFMWPSSSDKWRHAVRSVVLVDPSAMNQMCVAADLAILERAINDTYEQSARLELARDYWRSAVTGTLAEADVAASRYDEGEIFCKPPVSARALSIMK